MKSQEEDILAWLKMGRTITPLVALEHFGSFRLGARIHNLKKSGYDIKTTIVESKGKRFASYSLETEAVHGLDV